MTARGALFVHASVVAIGECGLLIEGPAGSGKSSLASALLGEAAVRAWHGRIVGDDRVGLEAMHGRLVARPHPVIAGLLEQRGVGLLKIPHQPAAVVRMVVALRQGGGIDRLPPERQARMLHSVTLPMLVLPAEAAAVDNARRILAALPLLLAGTLFAVPASDRDAP